MKSKQVKKPLKQQLKNKKNETITRIARKETEARTWVNKPHAYRKKTQAKKREDEIKGIRKTNQHTVGGRIAEQEQKPTRHVSRETDLTST